MAKTWMLIAHMGGARIYQQRAREWTLLRTLDHPEGRVAGHDLVSDRPGRATKGTSGVQTAYDSQHDPKEAEADTWAHTLIDTLHQGAGENAYDALVVAAPPRLLGLLRTMAPKEVTRRITHEFNHDYGKLDDMAAAVDALLNTLPKG